MNYEEWAKLDDLLNKEGYGGYYDLLELLKSYIRQWHEDKFGTEDIEKLDTIIQGIKTLHQATSMLTTIELRKK